MTTTTTAAGHSPALSTSSPPDYDLAVFIGRFQPLHLGHVSVIEMAFRHARNVLVLVGSAGAPRSHRNPFTFEERADMISNSFGAAHSDRLYVYPLQDAAYNDAQWTLNVQTAVDECLEDIAASSCGNGQRRDLRVTLIGHSKDSTAYYLNMFPAYESLEAPNHRGTSSTPMRNAYFSNIGDMWLKNSDGHRPGDNAGEHLVPSAVRRFLAEFITTPDYADIRAEYEFILAYQARWGSTPFPVTMVTADAMVIQSGHVLLVRRGGRPGRGLWALPGGFLKGDETIVEAMIRELVEETRIKVVASDLKKAIVSSRAFDDPNRDPRGRVITHAFRLDLPPHRMLPRITKKRLKLVPDVPTGGLETVEGGDDAELARWFPLNEIKREIMFADHRDIVTFLCAIATART